MNLLKKNSVTFPEVMRSNDQSAWPFHYPLIQYPDVNDSLNGGMGDLGIKIPPNSERIVTIILAQDTAFRLINFKYTVFFAVIPTNLTGTISISAGSTAMTGVGTLFTTELSVGNKIAWTDENGMIEVGYVQTITDNTNLIIDKAAEANAGVVVNYGLASFPWYTATVGTPPLENTLKVIPKTKYMRVSVIFPSLKARYMYGAPQEYFNAAVSTADAFKSGFHDRPRNMDSLQGFKDGVGMIRTPSLLPHEGSIRFKVTNLAGIPLYLNGNAFGYKIAIGRK